MIEIGVVNRSYTKIARNRSNSPIMNERVRHERVSFAAVRAVAFVTGGQLGLARAWATFRSPRSPVRLRSLCRSVMFRLSTWQATLLAIEQAYLVPESSLMCDVGPAVRRFGQLVVFRRRAEPRGWL